MRNVGRYSFAHPLRLYYPLRNVPLQLTNRRGNTQHCSHQVPRGQLGSQMAAAAVLPVQVRHKSRSIRSRCKHTGVSLGCRFHLRNTPSCTHQGG